MIDTWMDDVPREVTGTMDNLQWETPLEYEESYNYSVKRFGKEYVDRYIEHTELKKPTAPAPAPAPFKVFTREAQVQEFQKQQPIYYDSAGLWWLWNKQDLCWRVVDEVDILNKINEEMNADVITSKNRTEIINSLKQSGRRNKPLPFKNTWVQFKDTIFDVFTGEQMNPSPKYFTTSSIPHTISLNPATPTFDTLFEQWVGKDHVMKLYEILAYALIPDYPIHRVFCFVGEGMNGKSCFLKVLENFVGKENTCATELDRLLNSRFELSRLHKKLVCVMGETNFAEMVKTSILKQLTGQDLIGLEYKHKTPFDDVNYAKIIIATNNLPATTDKTIGFYRRWLIIDFPNRFTEQKDILATIPPEEYSNLATRCLTLLPELLRRRTFDNEGTVEDRMKRYEDRSNPFEKFWSENVKEDLDSFISKREFNEKLMNWCKENRFRILSDMTISKHMKDKGIQTERRAMEWVDTGSLTDKPRYWVWGGISWK